MPTTWYPDTCECVIEFDGSEPDDFSARKIRLCPRHARAPATAVRDILGENRTKNTVTAAIQTATGIDASGRDKWRVLDDGTVLFELEGITDMQISTISTTLSGKTGKPFRIVRKAV
jgi:hypothetical protein